MRKSRWVWPTVLVVLVGAGAPVFAETRDAAAADALFREARAAIKRRDFATAATKLADSQRLDPAPGTLLNLGECETELGKLASAWQHLAEAIDQFPPGDDRLPLARREWAALEKRVPKLTVRLAASAPPGTVVRRDDIQVGAASLNVALPVDPGEHVIVVVAPGHKDARFVARITERQAKAIDVAAGESAADEAVNVTAQPGTPRRASDARKGAPASAQDALGYAVAAAGCVATGVGGWFWWRGSQERVDKNACPATDAGCIGTHFDAERSADRYGNVLVPIGVAAVVGGVILVLTSPQPSTSPHAHVSFRPLAQPMLAGLLVEGTW